MISQQLTEADLQLTCDPLYMNGTQVLNPCGLIANSFFNGSNTAHTYDIFFI